MGQTEIDNLIELLARLPGIGPRSARRLALSMLKKPDSLMRPLSKSLIDTANSIKNSKLWSIKGMGHDFPYELFDEFVSRIDSHIKSNNKSEFKSI